MTCFAATADGASVEDSCIAPGSFPPRNAAPGIASKNKISASKLIFTRHLLRISAPIHYMTGRVCKSLAAPSIPDRSRNYCTGERGEAGKGEA